MYAIIIAFKETEKTQEFINQFQNFKQEMIEYGYIYQNDNLFFGNPDKINMVTGTISIVNLSKKFNEIFNNVLNVSIARIDMINDLTPYTT